MERREESTWNFVFDGVELCQQLLHQKRKVEVQLNEEVLKRKKCEEIVHKFNLKYPPKHHPTQENLCLRSAGNNSITGRRKWLLMLKVSIQLL